MKLTKGTQLYILDPRDSTITKLDCPKSITGLGESVPQIDTTCLDSDAMEFVPGMPSPNAATIGLDFDTAKASHLLIYDLKRNQVTGVQFAIGWSDGVDVAPTGVDSDNLMELPDTRSWLVFSGYVADLPFEFGINSTVQSNFTVQQSGSYDLIPKSTS